MRGSDDKLGYRSYWTLGNAFYLFQATGVSGHCLHRVAKKTLDLFALVPSRDGALLLLERLRHFGRHWPIFRSHELQCACTNVRLLLSHCA